MRVRSKFLACPLIPESGSCSRSVAVTFYYAYCYSGSTQFLDPLTVTVRSGPSSATVLVLIIIGLDPDTFSLVREEVLDF